MLWIDSARLGRLEYTEKQVIAFPQGLPGFDTYTRYLLLPLEEKTTPVYFYLQSLEEGDLGFLLIDPFYFFTDYECHLSNEIVETLRIEKEEDVLILTTVTVPGTIERATTNLKAPLVFNMAQRLALQVLLEDTRYLIKQPLFLTKPEAQGKGRVR